MSGESELKTIQRYTRVLSSTYATFPTTGLRAGDLSYATDEKLLYRWSGAAWEVITQHGMWNYLGKESPVTAATQTITFASYDLIKIVFLLTHSIATYLRARLNGISTAHYRSRWIDGNNPAADAANISFINVVEDSGVSGRMIGELVISGRPAGAGFMKEYYFKGSPHGNSQHMLLNGYLAGDNNDLESVVLYATTGSLTGEILAYGFNA